MNRSIWNCGSTSSNGGDFSKAWLFKEGSNLEDECLCGVFGFSSRSSLGTLSKGEWEVWYLRKSISPCGWSWSERFAGASSARFCLWIIMEGLRLSCSTLLLLLVDMLALL